LLQKNIIFRACVTRPPKEKKKEEEKPSYHHIFDTLPYPSLIEGSRAQYTPISPNKICGKIKNKGVSR
jgi:hypothetical protein